MSILNNYALICAALGWFIASVAKIIIILIRERRIDFRKLVASGGMPSSHSATVSSLAAAIGRTDGTGSSIFALACIFAFIVMYDAAGVRRAAGEQARILNQIVNNFQNNFSWNNKNDTVYLKKNLKELIGHTPLEVFAGSFLGILIALAVPYRPAA
ncbi:MAG: divergent PAP2 family protein [Oscillospiraceae bacterium]|nr:divergent PAP2 family protein [Oscillospiraceae bacterium]